jgi:soluble lytic murein transglycosylase-like protein
MNAGMSRVLARINEIRTLCGESSVSNGDTGTAFAGELSAADTRQSTGRRAMAPSELQPLIQEAASKTGVSEDLITAVIQAESAFSPKAVSPVGAQGLMQLMPATARGLGVQNAFDPRQNILGGAEYLRQQLNRFGSVEKALAAYNAGPGAVAKYGGVPPYTETRNYVSKIMRNLAPDDEGRP